jgi:serine/threonine protein phosphatase PrpC
MEILLESEATAIAATEAEAGTVRTGRDETHFHTISPLRVQNKVFDASSIIGLRPTQEDRLVLCPTLGDQNLSFAGIFDGTAGPEASEFIQKNIVSHLLGTELFQRSDWTKAGLDAGPEALGEIADQVAGCMREAFLSADRELIIQCREQQPTVDYASSTGVTALFWRNIVTIAHVGDSRACLVKISPGALAGEVGLMPEWLTVDHKPNTPAELQRIEQSGGSLVWLHGVKPYIRGGDFTARQQLGERPKQLNYSRAFGGKDLKNYGLIAEPDVSHFEIAANDRMLILGSDGLWDVLAPMYAAELALQAHEAGRSAADALVDAALADMPRCNVVDNVTAIVIFLNESV